MSYETLKVFVGDGNSTGTSKATLTTGDLLILNASDHSAYSSGSGDIVIAGKTDKGVIMSTPIKRAQVLSASFKVGAATTQKVVRFSLAAETLAASTDYSLAVVIKEDQRMVYNQNAKFTANYKTSSTISSQFAEATLMASSFAKQFANQPVTAYGNPARMVQVERIDIAAGTLTTLGTGANAAVVQGSRKVTTAATHAATAGSVVVLKGKLYIVDSVESTTVFYLDVPYEGTSETVLAGASASTSAGLITSGQIGFVFTGVAQGRENKYSQNKEVDFDVVYPRGFVTATPSVTTPFAPGVGTYAHIRDLEERAYTNAFPHINYREFPFEDWVFNVDNSSKSTIYNVLSLTYKLPMDYGDFMTGGVPATTHTVVIAAPYIATKDMDDDQAGSFAALINTWYGGPKLINSTP